MKKSELRERFRQKRKELSEEEIEGWSQGIADHFIAFLNDLEEPIHTIHLFLPIEKNREVNTWPLIERLREREGIRVVVSRTHFEEGRMEHFLLETDTILVQNELGIPEPHEGTPVPEQEMDLVVLPLMAYDEKGDRVGYGAGFYDRFLEACRDDVIKVGLSFFDPIERIEDVDEHDMVLDHCVTPERVYSFKGGA